VQPATIPVEQFFSKTGVGYPLLQLNILCL